VLTPAFEHPWTLPPSEAIALQRELAAMVIAEDRHPAFETVAGIDVAVSRGVGRAAVVVVTYPGLQPVETAIAMRALAFPYVPGLLSFREGPTVLAALAQLRAVPDVLMFDGQGIAHPRRLGLAAHMGVLLDLPTVGCAKSRLCGVAVEPATERGAWSPLTDDGDLLGAVLRTRDGVRPVYVSVGHRVSLRTAVALVLGCGAGRRLPEPTRLAHAAAAFQK
jgi:deoxyribonuclease V